MNYTNIILLIMRHIFAISLIFSLINTQIFAQTEPSFPFIESAEMLEAGKSFHDEQQYEEAIEKYLMVPESDSLFLDAQYELAYSYQKLEEYDKALDITRKLKNKTTKLQPLFYAMEAGIYNDLEEYEKSLQTIEDALQKFPYHRQLFYNKGQTLVNLEEYEKAYNSYRQASALNIFHLGSHYQIANLMRRQDLKSKALLSYSMALALNPDINMILVEMNDYVSGVVNDSDDSIDPFIDNSAFSQLETMINSEVAFSKNYKFDLPLDAPIVRQLHLLFHQFKYDASINDYWMSTYGPFLQVLQEKNLVDAYIYYLLKSTNNKKIAKWAKKNSKLIDQATSEINTQLKMYRSRPLNFFNEEDPRKLWFYDDNTFNAIGEGSEEEEKLIGNWEFYFSTGILKSKGSYNQSGNKEGKWLTYDEDGHLKMMETFKDGELEGEFKSYQFPGYAFVHANFKNSEANGIAKYIRINGTVREEIEFSEGTKQGKNIIYHLNGKPETVFENKGGEKEGKYEEFYASGSLRYTDNSVDGKEEGPYFIYFRNGSIKEKGFYKNGEFHDSVYVYHPNGNLKLIGNNIEGKRDGIWYEYYLNGTLSNEYGYENNLYVGETKYYNTDGTHFFSEIHNKSGTLVGYKTINPATGKLQEFISKNGTFDLLAYYPNGKIYIKAKYVKGLLQGEYVRNWTSGNIEVKFNFKDGLKHGVCEEYFTSGKLSYRYHSTDGEQNGFYQSFFENGNIHLEGWKIDGKKEQIWHEYFVNGKPKSLLPYNANRENGTLIEYDQKGKLHYKQYYEYGYLFETQEYDTLENILVTNKIDPQNEIHKIHFFNGNSKMIKKFIGSKLIHQENYYRNGEKSLELKSDDLDVFELKNYYLNGSLSREVKLIDDEKTGWQINYYESGKIKEKAYYYDGSLYGSDTSYYENGQIQSVEQYYDGKKHGSSIYYARSGEIMVEKRYNYQGISAYRNKTETGWTEWITFEGTDGKVEGRYPNGQISLIQHYKDGYFHGEQAYYYIDGQLEFKGNWENGNEVGEHINYYPNGQISQREFYVDDRLDGQAINYHKNGKIKSTRNYSHGILEGPFKVYDEEGKLIYESFYRNGEEY